MTDQCQSKMFFQLSIVFLAEILVVLGERPISYEGYDKGLIKDSMAAIQVLKDTKFDFACENLLFVPDFDLAVEHIHRIKNVDLAHETALAAFKSVLWVLRKCEDNLKGIYGSIVYGFNHEEKRWMNTLVLFKDRTLEPDPNLELLDLLVDSLEGALPSDIAKSRLKHEDFLNVCKFFISPLESADGNSEPPKNSGLMHLLRWGFELGAVSKTFDEKLYVLSQVCSEAAPWRPAGRILLNHQQAMRMAISLAKAECTKKNLDSFNETLKTIEPALRNRPSVRKRVLRANQFLRKCIEQFDDQVKKHFKGRYRLPGTFSVQTAQNLMDLLSSYILRRKDKLPFKRLLWSSSTLR